MYKELNEHITDLVGKPWDGTYTIAAVAIFHAETLEHKFLFDEDIVAYFELVTREAAHLGRAKLAYERAEKNNDATKLQEAKDKIELLENWLDKQITDMYEVFKKDLSIKSLR